MKFVATDLPGVVLVEPDVHADSRGYFLETHHQRKYDEGGIAAVFVQDNLSLSKRGSLRGLHAQRMKPQGKLVRVTLGEVFDVAVDIRVGSPTFGRHVALKLTDRDQRQLFIPAGFAHGFCVLSETAVFEYKCTDYYDASDEIAVRWDDPDLAIAWPIPNPALSAKDAAAPRLRDIPRDRLPHYQLR